MMKYYIILIFGFFNLTNNLIAQHLVSNSHDIDGLPINGVINPFIFHTKNNIQITLLKEIAQKGICYLKNGEVKSGYLYFDKKKLYFKGHIDSIFVEYKAHEIDYFTMGKDLFRASNNFYKRVGVVNGFELLEYSTIIKNGDYSREVVYYWFYNQDYRSNVSFTKKSIIPDHLNKKNKSTKQVRKNFYYFFVSEHYKSGESFYMDEHFCILNNVTSGFYEVDVSLLKKNRFELTFYKDKKRQFIIPYNYERFEIEIDGLYQEFHSDSILSRSIYFEQNKKRVVKVYSKSDPTQVDLEYSIPDTTLNHYNSRIPIYRIVRNEEGENIINSGKSRRTYKDPLSSRIFYETYKKDLLESSYFINKEDQKIYQWNYHSQGIISLLKRFSMQMNIPEKLNILYEEATNGMILTTFYIDEKGFVFDFEIIYAINKEVRTLTEEFINHEFFKLDPRFKIKFDKWKVGKEKRKYMVTVPMLFYSDSKKSETSNSEYLGSYLNWKSLY